MELKGYTMLHALNHNKDFGNVRVSITIDSKEIITETLYDISGKYPQKLAAVQYTYYEWCRLGMAVHDMHAMLKQEFGEHDGTEE